MFTGSVIHWSALILFLAVGLISLWVAHSFLGKSGLYVFTTLALIFSNLLPSVGMFSYHITISVVLMPLIYLALMVCYKKYGREEAIRLFFLNLIVLAVTFIMAFFVAAFIDSEAGASTTLRWSNFGPYIACLLAFTLAAWLGSIMLERFKMEGFLKRSLLLLLLALVDNIIFVVISLTFLSYLFTDVLLILAIRLCVALVVCFGAGYFAVILNREPAPEEAPAEDKKVEDLQTNKDVSVVVIAPADKVQVVAPQAQPATPAKAQTKPAAKKTATKKPAAKKPATKKTEAKPAAAKAPATKKAPAKKPATKKTTPATKKTVARKPATKKKVARKPATKKPVAKKTVAKKSTTPASKPATK